MGFTNAKPVWVVGNGPGEVTQATQITFPDGQSATIYLDDDENILAAFDISGPAYLAGIRDHWSIWTGDCAAWYQIYAGAEIYAAADR